MPLGQTVSVVYAVALFVFWLIRTDTELGLVEGLVGVLFVFIAWRGGGWLFASNQVRQAARSGRRSEHGGHSGDEG